MIKKVGKDEFCINCMEWREYDEEGRCKICKHKIFKDKKEKQQHGYNEYNSESPTFEADEESGESEY